MTQFRTQRITAADIRAGRIRIPSGHKNPFPDDVDRVALRLNGTRFEDVAWNPRVGPDQERSGVLYIGARLADLVVEDEVLEVVPGGVIELKRTGQ